MADYTQENRFISIRTPLRGDPLLLQGFTGQEGISRLFSFDVHLLSQNRSISFDEIIGQNVTIAVTLPDTNEKRYTNGFVSRFAQSGDQGRLSSYRAEIVPWLWFLTRTTNCRIFQDMTVPEIITKIFKELGFTDFNDKDLLQGSFERREYCVQYRETDFNFVSRLMEQYGIFYFFEHEEKKHTLVLAHSPEVHRPCPGQAQARCAQMGGAVEEEDVVTNWYMEQELRPGKYAMTDYNFETPSTSLAVNVTTTMNVGGNSKYELYEYPGEYLKKGQGERLVKLRMEEEEAFSVVARGSSNCRAFTPGYRFDLVGHSSPKMDKRYTLIEVRHVASVGDSYVRGGGLDGTGGYSNHFTCIPDKVPYRPQRVTPRPIVQGPQTAIVVGPAGEEIHTDKYGRIKVRFHWDHEDKPSENRSCWIRVSHPWAGKGWGSVSIPRVEQEVIVDFLEGDPDQPIITGRVYNYEQMPPYGLPAAGMVSGLKSNSTPGGGGYNEISMNDTKKKEQITVHAQYNMGTTVEHDDTQTVHNDRTITVDGTHTETIKKDTTITILEGPYKLDVQKNTHTHHVNGNVIEWYDATQETHVFNDITIISGNAKITLDAKTEIVLHCGDSLFRMKQDGTILLSGKNIEISGTNEVKNGVGNQNTVFNTQKVATSGAAINTSATGMHEITGAVVKIN